MEMQKAGHEFARLLERCSAKGTQPPLDRACLLVAAAFDDRADIDGALAQLDAWAAMARAQCNDATDSYAIAGAVIETLFRRLGFSGNAAQYNDPRNNMMTYVIEQRRGIPITLSILVMEVARRLGLQLTGIGLPGHFLVRFPDARSKLYIDAFGGGRIIDVGDCVTLVDAHSGGRVTWNDRFLDPIAPKAILKRVLLNLKNALSQRKNYAAALAAIELQLVLDPDDPTELRDRGILFARLHRYDRAIADLEAYLERSPHASDVKQIRDTVLRYLREARNL